MKKLHNEFEEVMKDESGSLKDLGIFRQGMSGQHVQNDKSAVEDEEASLI